MTLFWLQKGPYGAKNQNVANLSCGLSKLAGEGHSANEKKNIVPILKFGLILGPMWFKKGYL